VEQARSAPFGKVPHSGELGPGAQEVESDGMSRHVRRVGLAALHPKQHGGVALAPTTRHTTPGSLCEAYERLDAVRGHVGKGHRPHFESPGQQRDFGRRLIGANGSLRSQRGEGGGGEVMSFTYRNGHTGRQR
jgi:hypothetical protein